MSRRPWYKRYPSDFIAGTMMLTAEEKGVYSTIVDMLHDRESPIDNRPEDLWRICGCASLKRFRGIFERLVHLGKLIEVGDRITNSRFERDRKSHSESIPNANGIDSEHEKPPPDLLQINGLDSAIPEARSQIPEPSRTGAKARLPNEDLTLPERWQEHAATKGFDAASTLRMFEAFVDHHRKHGNAWADWNAAWRTWVANEIKFNDRKGGSSNATFGPNRSRGGGFSSIAARIRNAKSSVPDDGQSPGRAPPRG